MEIASAVRSFKKSRRSVLIERYRLSGLPTVVIAWASLVISPWYRRRRCSLRNPAVFSGFQPLLLSNLHDHFANGLEHRVRIDGMSAFLYNHLLSLSREPRQLYLELMDPPLVKSH